MREAYRARKAGLSAALAIFAACGTDADWEIIWDRLMKAAELERSLERFKR